MNRLKEKYLNEVVPSLKEKYNYKSIMEVPKLEKIVINMGVGDATQNSKLLEAAVADFHARFFSDVVYEPSETLIDISDTIYRNTAPYIRR